MVLSFELIRFINVFLAVLAIGAVFGALLLAFVPPLRNSIDSTVALWAAAAILLTMMAGSLFYSEVAGYPPCRLCWVQRAFAYPAAICTVYLAFRRKVNWWALPAGLSLVGLGVSVWHYLVQTFPALESGSSCDPSNPCSTAWMDTFGFVTIPFMAGCGFLAIAIISLSLVKREKVDPLTE